MNKKKYIVIVLAKINVLHCVWKVNKIFSRFLIKLLSQIYVQTYE